MYPNKNLSTESAKLTVFFAVCVSDAIYVLLKEVYHKILDKSIYACYSEINTSPHENRRHTERNPLCAK